MKKVSWVDLKKYDKCVLYEDISLNGARHIVLRFDNNFGASITDGTGLLSYGMGCELAVIRFFGENPKMWELYYKTKITDDVLPCLSDSEVREYLKKIEKLPGQTLKEIQNELKQEEIKRKIEHQKLKIRHKVFDRDLNEYIRKLPKAIEKNFPLLYTETEFSTEYGMAAECTMSFRVNFSKIEQDSATLEKIVEKELNKWKEENGYC